MKTSITDKALGRRIRDGTLRREDIARRLAELAFGPVNDCVRLALEDHPQVETLNLSNLCEVKRSDKGAVEVKLVDRLQALTQLLALAQGDETGLDEFLTALQGGNDKT